MQVLCNRKFPNSAPGNFPKSYMHLQNPPRQIISQNKKARSQIAARLKINPN
jgi:hypothetical protein